MKMSTRRNSRALVALVAMAMVRARHSSGYRVCYRIRIIIQSLLLWATRSDNEEVTKQKCQKFGT